MKRSRLDRPQLLVVKVIGTGGIGSRHLGSKRIVGETDGRRRRGRPIGSRDLTVEHTIPSELPEVRARDLNTGDIIERDGKLHRVVDLTDRKVVLARMVGGGTLKSQKKRLKLGLDDTVNLFRRGGGGNNGRHVDSGHSPHEAEYSPHQRGRHGWVAASEVHWVGEVQEPGAGSYIGDGGGQSHAMEYEDEQEAERWI